MPPKGGRLTGEQVALLKAWIDAGAPWPDDAVNEKKHWAYVKPVRPELPAVTRVEWVRNPIDRFALARLEQEGLSPSPEADRATLIRRASLDLVGLPPTIQDVDAFLNDPAPDAFEKVVKRLLASRHFGERWARPWLDMARYADTQGYEKDNRRSIWPWRDWVVDALNRNLPFDQFTIEQIAGDMLPNATLDQKVATGFHRNTMTNTEGGTDDEEFRHEAVVDRVNTTMSVWMGTTFNCAQCHNHKYDPFTMKEYYEFYAFLNHTADSDKDDERPTIKLPTPAQERRAAALRERIAPLDKQLNTPTPALDAAMARWASETEVLLKSWEILDPTSVLSAGGATLTKQPDKSVLAGGANPGNDVYTVVAPVRLKRITGIRLEVLPDPSLPQKSLGRAANGSFVLSRIEATIALAAKWQDAHLITFNSASADYSQDRYSVTNLISGPPGSGWATRAFEEKFRVPRSALLTVARPAEYPSGAILTVTLRHDSRFPEANVGRFRVSVTSMNPPGDPPAVPEAIAAILNTPTANRTEKQKKELLDHWRSTSSELEPVRDELARLRKEELDLDNSLPVTAVMQELEKPRETHLLVRGSFLSPGDKVLPGTPAVLHPLPPDQRPNRFGLARWLVDTNNPLTARVAMNRLWEAYFGIGIVETAEDFGTQGESPSHPELLDWLATEFMARGWDLKAMHKLIVTSATYRQSSRVSPALAERDPYNRLLARGPRVRLDAETLRDQALAVSGLLSAKMGGPPVMPPQPDGIWQVVYSGDKWETSAGEDRYRRGIYTFWRRTSPYPSMVSFDAPSREYCVVKRNRSDTPLQALTLLNDPVYVEAAQALARRMADKEETTPAARVSFGFRRCLARTPAEKEVQRLVALYEQQLARFKANPAAAENMATRELGKTSGQTDVAELAAWTVVANVLLNLDEFISKG
jgi:hypothetical protein